MVHCSLVCAAAQGNILHGARFDLHVLATLNSPNAASKKLQYAWKLDASFALDPRAKGTDVDGR